MKELFEKQDKELQQALSDAWDKDNADMDTEAIYESHISKIRQETRDIAYTKGFDDAMLTVERGVEKAKKETLQAVREEIEKGKWTENSRLSDDRKLATFAHNKFIDDLLKSLDIEPTPAYTKDSNGNIELDNH